MAETRTAAICYSVTMSDFVESQSIECAYATKSNIVVPPEAAPTATHLTEMQARAVGRMNDGTARPTTTAVKTLKKG